MKKKTHADLFKPQKNMAPIVEEQESFLGISKNGSGSSGLSTPFGSELGSSGTSGSEDEEFMAELSRKMAECMLIEEENHAKDGTSSVCSGSEVYRLKNQPRESGIGERRVKGNRRVPNMGRNSVYSRRNGQGIGGSGMKAIFLDNSGSRYGSGGTGVFLPRFSNDLTPEKKKPAYKKQKRRRRNAEPPHNQSKDLTTAATQPSQKDSSEPTSGRSWSLLAKKFSKFTKEEHKARKRRSIESTDSGSSLISGNSVCSTVLMPVRVLQTLELHFSRLSYSSSSISRGTSPPRCIDHDMPWTHSGRKDTRNGLLSPQNVDPRFQSHLAQEEEEKQLPQEWTY